VSSPVIAVTSEAVLKVLRGAPARVVMRVEEGGTVAAASFSGLPLDFQARWPHRLPVPVP